MSGPFARYGLLLFLFLALRLCRRHRSRMRYKSQLDEPYGWKCCTKFGFVIASWPKLTTGVDGRPGLIDIVLVVVAAVVDDGGLQWL